jgi:hypothetical protein
VPRYVTPNFPAGRIEEGKPERQLSLLKGPRQRGIVPRAQASEFELHCAVADTLRKCGTKSWVWLHIPNGGWRTKAEAAKFTRMGVKAGVPDLLLIGPTGTHYWLELKTKYGRLTDEQADFVGELAGRNVPHAVAWGYDEAIAHLKAWGAVKVSL